MAEMNFSVKEKQTHRHVPQTCGCQGGGGWRRDGLEFGASRCKLVYIEWINSKVLAQGTRFNILQFNNGKEYLKECVYIYM